MHPLVPLDASPLGMLGYNILDASDCIVYLILKAFPTASNNG